MSSPSAANPFADDRLPGAGAYHPELDVPSVNQATSAWLVETIHRATRSRVPSGEAKVAVLRAGPGYGKTHILGRVGHCCGERGLLVFVPQVEEDGAPVRHVHWHVVETLFQAPAGRAPVLHRLLARLCHHSFRRYFDFLPYTVKEQHQGLRQRLENDPAVVMEIVRAAKEAAPFLALADSIAGRLPTLPPDVVRALVLGWSPRAAEARRWLRGEDLEQGQLAALRLPEQPPTTTRLLQTLAALLHRLGMSLVISCDQSEGLLRRDNAVTELTTSLIGWLDAIPNLVLILSCLDDRWEPFKDRAFKAFPDRTRDFDLQRLTGAQAVELVRRRLEHWPGKRPEKGPVWPFREADILALARDYPLSARGLLKRCAAALEGWTAKRSESEIHIGGEDGKRPVEDLFRQEWGRSLEALRKEQLSPDNLQEERLFRAIREALGLLRLAGTTIGGLELLQVQDGALASTKANKYLSLQLKLGVKSSQAAVPVVVALTKHNGGTALRSFVNALDAAVADPVAGAVVVRPTATITVGPKTDTRAKLDALTGRGKLRVFALADHAGAFENLECLVRLLDRAGQKDLQLGQETISAELCRGLVVKTQVLAGLDLLESIFAGWPQAAVATVTTRPAAQAAPAPAAAAVAAKPAAPARPAAPVPPTAPPPPGATWAEDLLKAVADKLTEFGQRVEPLGVDIGPTFARIKLRPLGKTSMGKVRNHANDLRTHIPAVGSVPVIADQPGYISVDVQRPDRQTVPLADCLRRTPAPATALPAFPVGADVAGRLHWLNLADPGTCHLLVAGTTGSGKSEFLKSLLAGLAARHSPLELRLVLVDPKRVTFNFPGGSPYLLHPVAHTVDEAMPLVEQCFAETERRYALLEERGLEHIGQLGGKDALPRIVVVFDEFADLMADKESRRELEGTLKRVGALARAAGIHLVLATQRPDKDVVTPQLKANLPTRVCLRVDGERNSVIVLDEDGAQHLLGHGDLFWRHGGGMLRLQAPLVNKAEQAKLLRFGA